MSKPADKRKILFTTATAQFGLFTAKQAETAGYNRKHFNDQLESGEWTRETRGVFRLNNYPSSPEQEYMRWVLWSRNRADVPQGCLSHQTALYIYKLGDQMPTQIHMSVPKDFRRSAQTPSILALHSQALKPRSTQTENGLPVTTVAKTIEDLLDEGTIEQSALEESLARALELGMITKKQIIASKKLQGLQS